MMLLRRPNWLFALLLLAGTLACGSFAHAQSANSLQEAVERVQRETGGKILSAETVQQGRQAVYRIKVLTRDGRVHVVTVSAADNGRGNDRAPQGRRGIESPFERRDSEVSDNPRARERDTRNNSDNEWTDKED